VHAGRNVDRACRRDPRAIVRTLSATATVRASLTARPVSLRREEPDSFLLCSSFGPYRRLVRHPLSHSARLVARREESTLHQIHR
jgi:hypothetical protein